MHEGRKNTKKRVKFVQDMHDGGKTKVRTSVGLIKSVALRVELHQSSALNLYLIDLIIHVMSQNNEGRSQW